MLQDRLFVLAPEAIIVSAAFVEREGWRVTIAMRRQGDPFSDGYRATYSHLSTAELADVVCSEVCHQLATE